MALGRLIAAAVSGRPVRTLRAPLRAYFGLFCDLASFTLFGWETGVELSRVQVLPEMDGVDRRLL